MVMYLHFNPCKIPLGVEPQCWINNIINIYCRAYEVPNEEKYIFADILYSLYEEAGIFDDIEAAIYSVISNEEWKKEVSKRSGAVTFHKVYKRLAALKDSASPTTKRAGSNTMDAYSRLTERLSCFNRPYSIEYKLFSAEDNFDNEDSVGLNPGVDEILDLDGLGDILCWEEYLLFPDYHNALANFARDVILSGIICMFLQKKQTQMETHGVAEKKPKTWRWKPEN